MIKCKKNCLKDYVHWVFSWSTQSFMGRIGVPLRCFQPINRAALFLISFWGQARPVWGKGSEPKVISHMLVFLMDLVMGPYVCRHLGSVCWRLEMVFAWGRLGRGSSSHRAGILFGCAKGKYWLSHHFPCHREPLLCLLSLVSSSSLVSSYGMFVATEYDSHGQGHGLYSASQSNICRSGPLCNCFQSLMRKVQK